MDIALQPIPEPHCFDYRDGELCLRQPLYPGEDMTKPIKELLSMAINGTGPFRENPHLTPEHKNHLEKIYGPLKEKLQKERARILQQCRRALELQNDIRVSQSTPDTRHVPFAE
jgi:hypothetical protein